MTRPPPEHERHRLWMELDGSWRWHCWECHATLAHPTADGVLELAARHVEAVHP